jgi:replication-associated recombination protein RarA
VTRQVSHGYDALYRDAKAGKKGGSWIVWHPYALFPVHRVEITDTNRAEVLKCLPESTQGTDPVAKISFAKPSGVVSADEEKRPKTTSPPANISDDDLEKLRLLVGSVNPLYEKLTVWYPWDGKTFSTGAAEAIPQRIEKTLASKLSFVPSNVVGAKEDTNKSPFGGIKYLQNLQKQEKLKEDGDLFLALELLAVRKQDTAEACSKLEGYVTRACEEGGGYAHPLVIVAIARLAVRLSQAKSSVVQRKLVGMFASLYPDASALWLTEAESGLVPTEASQASAQALNIVGSVTVQDKWESLKSQYGCQSEAMEELLKLVGLKKVKQAAVNLFKNAMAFQRIPAAQRKKNMMAFNYCFVGNPGTGKTTVARLFADVLKNSRIRRTSTFVECTAQKVKDDGADEFRLKIGKATGGVLFIDEAYVLDPVGDFKGKPIVAELLTAAEDKRDDLSIILAGYEDDIQKKLYAYNDGLPSRFEEVSFEGFDAQDLEVIWDRLAKDRGWEYEKAIAKIACRRLAKAAGRKGFGNARAVRKLFEQAVKEAMAREDFDGVMKFKAVDLLGDRPSSNPKLQVVLDEVDEKTGWRKIKEEMRKLVRISDENYERELKGQETVPLCLNRLFLGNPGTGKMTCAGYYGRVLKALHFLSDGEVVKKTAGDFIGSHVGESQTKTTQILDMAKGKVLVIDEAYNLNDNMYGKQVLDVLVEKVQGTESDDLAVLLIGYEHEMLEMLRTQNPGLMRRFPPQYAFQFEDYTEHELLDILEWNCAKRSVSCPYDVAEALLKQLALQKTQPNFGNAGAVEQLLKHAMGKAMSRPMVNGMTVLTLADVGAEDESKEQKDPLALLDKLYRMDEIREQLTQLRNQMIVADREGSGLPEIGHFVFRGSPGTGKTTVARVMAEILHGMGVLATKKLVETSGLDLTGEYLGQTKKKVTEKLGEAKGGLLFIDEAYELGKGKYGEEAMTTLVAAMTDPSYQNMVIIIAGYPKDMDQMLDRNVGLKSRFTRFIDFPDLEAQDAVVFLSEKAEAENFEVEAEAVESLQKTFVELKKLSNFGNGRDAVRVWKEVMQCRAERVVEEPEEERTITESDAEMAGDNILVARRGGGKPGKGVAADEDPMKLLDGLYRMDQIRQQLCRLQREMAVADSEGSTRPEIGHFVFRGSPGTGKTTVARVMAQILHAMSALGTTKLVETSGLDLTGEYLGQTKVKVTEKLVEAKGGLLFIDEAYELGKGHFGEEAMTTLVAAMTDPSYAGMVIVIAGYPKDMDVMLNRNAGLKSRFTRFIDFPDWEAEDGVAFLQAKAEKEGVRLGPGVDTVLHQTFQVFKRLDGFGNGRDAVRVWKELLQCRAQRVFSAPEEVRTMTAEDAVMAGESVLAARRPPDGPVLSQSSLSVDTSMFKTQEREPQVQEPEEVLLDEELEEKAMVEESVEVEAEEDPDVEEEVEKNCKEERDPGVSDEDWEELERAKEAHAAHLKELQRAKEAHAAHLEQLRRARDRAKQEEDKRRAQAKLEEEMRRAKAEADEEARRAKAIQDKIRQICPCPAGFNWYKSVGGWRCGGGSHFVSDEQLNRQFTR